MRPTPIVFLLVPAVPPSLVSTTSHETASDGVGPLAVTDRDIHESYDFSGPILGKGSFATVLRVRDRMSGTEYAVKQVRGNNLFRTADR